MKAMPLKLTLVLMVCIFIGCNNEESLNSSALSDAGGTTLIDVAQTSGQLASGTNFRISSSSTDSAGTVKPKGKQGHHKPNKGILDGVSMLAPTEELLVIIDAESAGDFRGLRIAKNGGATVTHYDANNAIIALSIPVSGGPNGCSFSGNQYPEYDSLLSAIVRTEIDFGTGVTFKRDTITITRSGKIITTRSGDAANKTEVTTFDNYYVNGAKIESTKTRVSTFDSATGSGNSVTSVTDGKITFQDGTVASWDSDRSRTSEVVLGPETGRPISGTVVTEVNTAVTLADGTTIYSHKTSVPLTENLACESRRHGPVSGTLETIYREDTVSVNYGDDTCENRTITITLNGVTITKTIGG